MDMLAPVEAQMNGVQKELVKALRSAQDNLSSANGASMERCQVFFESLCAFQHDVTSAEMGLALAKNHPAKASNAVTEAASIRYNI